MKRKAITSVIRAFTRCYSAATGGDYAIQKWMAQNFGSFYCKDLTIEKTAKPAAKPPDWDRLVFGNTFSDHMFEVDWSANDGWGKPRIVPLHDLKIHPAAKVLHYAIELFEGMKAYRGVDNKIRLFRPDQNMKRMVTTAARACLPTFDGEELSKCLIELVRIDQEWVPYSTSSSLYIRPTFIGIDPTLGVARATKGLLFAVVGPVGAFFPTGFKPVTLYAHSGYVRAWSGGGGNVKMGSNYAPTILIGKIAQDNGCQQVLWLHGEQEHITEVGTMNIFIFLKNEKGEKELVTPPLDSGLILPGVTRQSLLDLAREWKEFKVSERPITMQEIKKALKENRLLEMFGSGTACIVCPVEGILYVNGGKEEKLPIPTMQQNPCLMQRLFTSITDIQYGRVAKPSWTRLVPS